jgi:hypothetical protein
MGHTHYWKRKRDFDPELFVDAMRDCKSICQRLEIPLGSWLGVPDEHPLFDAEQVTFNGQGDDAHETFLMQQSFGIGDMDASTSPDKIVHDFCKTAKKPYDLAVMCCLVIFKSYLGDAIVVTSDGTQAEWQPAIDKIGEVFGPKFLTRPFVLGE